MPGMGCMAASLQAPVLLHAGGDVQQQSLLPLFLF